MWRAIEVECAVSGTPLKKFVLGLVEGHVREVSGWKQVGVVPRFSARRQMWFADADMELIRRYAGELHVKWTELVFACVLRWYQSRTEHDASRRGVSLQREVPPDCLERHVPLIRDFYAFWRAAGGPVKLPSLAALRDAGLARFADQMQVVEVLAREPLDLVYIEAGRIEIAARGENPVGLKVAEGFIGDTLNNVLGNYRMVIETGRPICIGPFRSTEVFLEDDGSIFAPCSDNGAEVSHILVLSAFRQPQQPSD